MALVRGRLAIAYERLKKPESEMAQMTHNDYLEQASDSGVAGLFDLCRMVVVGLFNIYLPKRRFAGKLGEAGGLAGSFGVGYAKRGRVRAVYSGDWRGRRSASWAGFWRKVQIKSTAKPATG